jgi:hypothetical protein
MKKDHGKYFLFAFAVGIALTIVIGFVDEGRYTLSFLTNLTEVINLLFIGSFFALFPIGLYFALHRLNVTRLKAWTSVGFLPAIVIIVLNIIY